MRHYAYAFGSGVALFIAVAVSAVVLPENSSLEKHREDVNKQTNKMVACMAKAVIKCESKGADSGPECNLTTGTAVTPDSAANLKFAETAGPGGKCESKLDFLKKGPASDYDLVGCPGDSDDGTLGDQRYTDYSALQADSRTNVAEALNLITPVLAAFCGGVPATSNPDVLDCMEVGAKGLLKYAKGAGKCMLKCENDHSDEIGDGGDADDLECNAGDSTDTNFNTCISEASAKGAKKIPTEACGADGDPGCLSLAEYLVIEGGVSDALNEALNDSYNEDDC